MLHDTNCASKPDQIEWLFLFDSVAVQLSKKISDFILLFKIRHMH